jgi:zinc transport system substrate-binding protein
MGKRFKRGYNSITNRKGEIVMKPFKNLIFILIIVLLILQLYTMYSDKNANTTDTQPVVAVSSFSLYDITKHIAKDSVKIVNILPFGVDPHSFEPTPKLMADIEKSNLVLYSGAGLEPWTHGFAFKSRAIDMSEHVALRELGANEHDHHQHHDEQCAHNTIDPHYWLDFANMQRATLLIRDELIKLQPKYEKSYMKNAQEYIEMLQRLEKNFKKYLSSCRLDVVIVNHNAIGYLARNYGFNVESLSGLSPEAQPSAKDLTRIFEDIQADGVSTIFFENFVNNKAIRTVANDAKVELEVLQPLGNITADEAKKKLTYEEIMYANLDKLTKALKCN